MKNGIIIIDLQLKKQRNATVFIQLYCIHSHDECYEKHTNALA